MTVPDEWPNFDGPEYEPMPEPDTSVSETGADPVPATVGPYTSGNHLVLRGGAKVAACYPDTARNMTAEQVADMIAETLNK